MIADTTLIRVNTDTKHFLERLRLNPRESFNSVIRTLLSQCYQLPEQAPEQAAKEQVKAPTEAAQPSAIPEPLIPKAIKEGTEVNKPSMYKSEMPEVPKI